MFPLFFKRGHGKILNDSRGLHHIAVGQCVLKVKLRSSLWQQLPASFLKGLLDISPEGETEAQSVTCPDHHSTQGGRAGTRVWVPLILVQHPFSLHFNSPPPVGGKPSLTHHVSEQEGPGMGLSLLIIFLFSK